MAKAKPSTKPKESIADDDRQASKAHPDRKLIAACVDYAFTMGGSHHAYQVDPTDAHFAGPTDMANIRKARGLPAKISDMKARSFAGMAAKAKLVVMMGDTHILDTISDDEIPLLVSLAEDVCRFHRNSGGNANSSPSHKAFGSEAQ